MKSLFTLFFVIILFSGSAQDESDESSGDFGIGIGMDYGGFGGRFAVRPTQSMALFAGIGYNLNGLGFNGGVQWRISPQKKTVPTLGFMYGYNGVIVVEGASQYNKTYYGPSVSAGLEFHSRKKRANYFNLEVILPFRPQEFTNDMNAMKSSGIIFKNEPWPIAISLGYHWGF